MLYTPTTLPGGVTPTESGYLLDLAHIETLEQVDRVTATEGEGYPHTIDLTDGRVITTRIIRGQGVGVKGPTMHLVSSFSVFLDTVDIIIEEDGQ